jgi:uncharacterized protein YndB with AHSA1/START domain
MVKSPDDLVLTRIIDAPRERVWEAWTVREELMKWWGQPNDATMPECSVDLNVGGQLRYSVQLPDGTVIRGKGIYREIKPQEKLVFNDYYCDESGNEIINDEFPEMMITAEFEAMGEKTKLTIRHSGISKGKATMDQYNQGWSESLDRLEEELDSL